MAEPLASGRSLAGLLATLLMMASVALVAGCDATADLEQNVGTARAVGPSVLEAPGPLSNRVRIEADVSTRSVAITSSFTGIEIIVFGAIINADPEATEEGEYKVIVVLEGAPQEVVVRKKDRVGGLWMNTEQVLFEEVPSFYALFSSEPLAWITTTEMLNRNNVGFERVQMKVIEGEKLSEERLAEFRAAVLRLKANQGRYVQNETGVVFVGHNLFRATVDLPANVPVGTLSARVQLYRDGELLDMFRTNVQLERQGLERLLFVFAFNHPLLYGMLTLLIAIAAGLLASAVVARTRRR